MRMNAVTAEPKLSDRTWSTKVFSSRRDRVAASTWIEAHRFIWCLCVLKCMMASVYIPPRCYLQCMHPSSYCGTSLNCLSSCHMAAFSQPQTGIDFSNVWLHMLCGETMISETQINGHIYWLQNKISLEFMGWIWSKHWIPGRTADAQVKTFKGVKEGFSVVKCCLSHLTFT